MDLNTKHIAHDVNKSRRSIILGSIVFSILNILLIYVFNPEVSYDSQSIVLKLLSQVSISAVISWGVGMLLLKSTS